MHTFVLEFDAEGEAKQQGLCYVAYCRVAWCLVVIEDLSLNLRMRSVGEEVVMGILKRNQFQGTIDYVKHKTA